MHPFRSAVEARDVQAVEALLAEDVVFFSPVVHKPYTGRPITAAILRGVLRVFEDFRYVREIGDPEGRDHALVFTATVNGREVHGCDFLHTDDDGRIDEFTVMVRPLSAAHALSEAMGAQFEQIAQEAAAYTSVARGTAMPGPYHPGPRWSQAATTPSPRVGTPPAPRARVGRGR